VISKFDYGYDAQGQITSWTQEQGTNTADWANQYDNEGKLTNVNITTSSNVVTAQYPYVYDAAGNRTSSQPLGDGDVVTSTNNVNNQLTSQSAGGSMVVSGTISKAGTVTINGNPAMVTASNVFTGTATVAGTNSTSTTDTKTGTGIFN
jgi:YD repeat-containing protein